MTIKRTKTKTLKKKVSAFAGNPFDADAIAAHHDAVAAAPWLSGTATLSAEMPRRGSSLRFPGVESYYKILDDFEEAAHRLEEEAYDDGGDGIAAAEAAAPARRCRAIAEQMLSVRFGNAVTIILPGVGYQTRRVDLADYDLVFVDENWKPACAAVAELSPSRVAYITDVKQEHTDPRSRRCRIPATLTALLRRLGDEVELRRQQITMSWTPSLPTVSAPTLDDSVVDAAITTHARSTL